MLRRKIITASIVILSIFIGLFEINAQGDDSFRMKLESILHQFKNYRFSTISVYKIKTTGISAIRSAIQEKKEQESLGSVEGATDASLDEVPKPVQNIIENGITAGKTKSQIRRDIDAAGYKVPDTFDGVYQVIFNKVMNMGDVKTIRDIYVVTTKMGSQDITPSTIIAMIVTYEGSLDLKTNLDRAQSEDIFTYPELVNFDLSTLTKNDYKADNMYKLVETAFLQENVEDVTLAARGIGTLISFAPTSLGNTSSLIYNEDRVNDYDIQAFLRISNGQPLDMFRENELIVSPDLISWKKYEYFRTETGEIDSLYPTNLRLPKVGVEIKYGIDGINYPSLWSERITASAMWQNVRLGMILPTNGYSSISTDAFDMQRTMTYAGFGIAGGMDFPISVIPQSGIFKVDFGYVFGDAKRSDFNPINNELNRDPQFIDPIFQTENPDHLVRFNAKIHYTFGMAIDQDYQLRFGLGGTGYQIEHWNNRLNGNDNKVNYVKADEEFIGGISGEVEFMAKNITTPWGIGVQYFDQGIFTNLWLQIPIVENVFSFRLDAKGYFKAFADEPRAWENESVFFPMARLIFNF